MTTATLEQIAKAVVAGGWAARDVTVVWHAGEPLVLPPSWYEDAFALFESYRPAEVCMTHALQTNGTLLNERWLPIVSRRTCAWALALTGRRLFITCAVRREAAVVLSRLPSGASDYSAPGASRFT
jgi:uncharacterized protein